MKVPLLSDLHAAAYPMCGSPHFLTPFPHQATGCPADSISGTPSHPLRVMVVLVGQVHELVVVHVQAGVCIPAEGGRRGWGGATS